MPETKEIAKVVSQWIKKAENDLRIATLALKTERNCPTDAISFHAQVSVHGRAWPKLLPIGGLLSISSFYAIRLPKKMAGPSSIPTDTRNSGHARSVDIHSLSRRL